MENPESTIITEKQNEEIHLLNSTWNFWYASRKEKDHNIPYTDRLIKISEFDNLELFLQY